MDSVRAVAELEIEEDCWWPSTRPPQTGHARENPLHSRNVRSKSEEIDIDLRTESPETRGVSPVRRVVSDEPVQIHIACRIPVRVHRHPPLERRAVPPPVRFVHARDAVEEEPLEAGRPGVRAAADTRPAHVVNRLHPIGVVGVALDHGTGAVHQRGDVPVGVLLHPQPLVQRAAAGAVPVRLVGVGALIASVLSEEIPSFGVIGSNILERLQRIPCRFVIAFGPHFRVRARAKRRVPVFRVHTAGFTLVPGAGMREPACSARRGRAHAGGRRYFPAPPDPPAVARCCESRPRQVPHPRPHPMCKREPPRRTTVAGRQGPGGRAGGVRGRGAGGLPQDASLGGRVVGRIVAPAAGRVPPRPRG